MNLNMRNAIMLTVATSLVVSGLLAGLWVYKEESQSKDFKFFAIGDTQGTEELFNKMIEDANSQKPAFVLHLGDITSIGMDTQFNKFLNASQDLEVPLHTTPGNHDIKNGGTETYENHFGPGDYYFEYRHTLFVSVDTSFASLTETQYDWLEEAISKDYERKIVFTHVPPIDPRDGEDHGFLDTEDGWRFVSLLQDNNVNMLLNGHIHYFNETLRGDTLFVTSGGGGANLYEPPNNGGFYHYLKIEISDSGIEVIPIPLNVTEPSSSPFITIKRGDGAQNITLEDLKKLDTVEGMSAFENQYGNWKGQGTYEGVFVKDLVELNGGMEQDGEVLVRAWDGYEQKYGYTNIYPNSTLLSIQGEMILAYSFEDENVPDWEDGFRVVFLPQDESYSNEDALQTTDEDLLDGDLVSAGSRWVKNVAEIEIA